MPATAGPSPLAERLLAVIASLAGPARDPDIDDETLLLHATRTLGELRHLVQDGPTDAPPSFCRMDALAATLLSDYEVRRAAAAEHGGVVGVRTGIGHLDETVNGLEKGKLYTLAAMPGAGKTTLALQIAATIAQSGEPALYVSLENDATDLARKTVCRLAEVSYSAALKGKVSPRTWHEAVGELTKLRGNLYLSTPRSTMPALPDLVEGLIEQAGRSPALVVLDYLQAFAKRSMPVADEVGVRDCIDRLTPQLRTLAERYGCAVVAISSQNRAGYNSGGMTSLKESGNIEYDSDVVLTLATVVEDPPPPGPSRRVRIEVAKNRQGMTGRPIELILRGDYCMIEEEDEW